VDGEYGGIGFQMAGHLWNPALAGGNYVGANATNDIATIYDSFADDLVYSKASGGLNAAVYTQITDVENECNGLFTYDRVLKPALNKILTSNQKGNHWPDDGDGRSAYVPELGPHLEVHHQYQRCFRGMVPPITMIRPGVRGWRASAQPGPRAPWFAPPGTPGTSGSASNSPWGR